MFEPNALVAPLTTRSGEIAPLNVNRLALVTVPLWNRVWVAGAISYQRTWAPAPPNTVCWVHRPTDVPCAGSIADTAWVFRVSDVSRVLPLPFCGAAAGTL